MWMRYEQLELFPEISTRLSGPPTISAYDAIAFPTNERPVFSVHGNAHQALPEIGSVDRIDPRHGMGRVRCEPALAVGGGGNSGIWSKRDLSHRPAGMAISGLFDHFYKTYP